MVFTDRDATSMKRPMNQVTALGVVFLAARNAMGMAMKNVAMVPRVAMCTVSTRGSGDIGKEPPVRRQHAGDEIPRLLVGVEHVHPGNVQLVERPHGQEHDA